MHLELLYCPYGTESCFTNPFSPDYPLTLVEKTFKEASAGAKETADDLIEAAAKKKNEVILRGVVSVTVIAAEDLPSVDFMGKADPFVVLTMKKSGTTARTRVRF